MIDKAFVQKMALYNEWQNKNIYGSAEHLSDEAKKRQCGAFFGSIHGTLNHLLWGDQIWMWRFANTPKPAAGIKESTTTYQNWDDLKREREAFDLVIIDWAAKLDPKWLEGDLTYYSSAAGKELSLPKWLLVTHMFNHQTHHRGQIHCMLTQNGERPGDTDLPFLR